MALHRSIAIGLAVTVLFGAGVHLSAQARFEVPNTTGTSWYKGNTHAHTVESDGDSSPEYVAQWYKAHGYNFLVISDHNVFTDTSQLSHLTDSDFILIPGEELSTGYEGLPVHVNGLNLPGLVDPRTGSTMVATIQNNVDAIREVEGVPHVNHPNFRWAFGAEELAQVESDRLLEIYNGHPTVHNDGGGGFPSVEEIWDILLTGGKRIYGIAVDDAHHFQGEFSADRANPGRGWISVRARSLDAAEIMQQLEAGQFYASTGVRLADVVVVEDRLEIHIAPREDFRYSTTFIGSGGRVLSMSSENPAVYTLQGRERYVRAKVTDSRGDVAWVQPVFSSSRRRGRSPYTPDRSGRCPVLSPNVSTFTPNFSRRLNDRFASGVPAGYTRWRFPSSPFSRPPMTMTGTL